MTLADFATPLQVVLTTHYGNTPHDNRHLLWAGDSSTGAVGTVTIMQDEIGKRGGNKGIHTRDRRRSVSGDLSVDNYITMHSSDLPDNHLMKARDMNVLAINRSMSSTSLAYRCMGRDQ